MRSPPTPRSLLAVVAVACLAACGALQRAAPGRADEVDRAVAEHVLPPVIAQLQSSDAATVAWGGHVVQRNRLDKAVPEVRAALKRWTTDNTAAGECARLALLDAILQVDVDLPDAELLPLLQGRTHDAAVVIAARRPRDHAAVLLAVFRERDGSRWATVDWILAGELLAARKEPAFVAALLQHVHHVVAMASEVAFDAESTVGLRGSISCGRRHSLPGFPPLPAMELHRYAPPGSIALADGDATVSWSRSLAYTWPCGTTTENADPLLQQWLAAVAPEGPSWTPEPVLATADADEYRRQVEALRRDRATWFAAKTAALQGAGRLTTDEVVALRRDVDLVVEDLRYPAGTPLPDLPGVRNTRP